MSTTPKDPLLTAGKVLTNIVKILLVIVFAGLVIALPIFFLNQHNVAETLGENAENLTMVMATITGMLIIGAALVATAFKFFQFLGNIIDTVGFGDPFVARNAERLEKMGWFAVAFQFASIPLTAGLVFLRSQFPGEDIQIDVDFSLTGILLAIVLFILARVFRHGAALREDLEGTV